MVYSKNDCGVLFVKGIFIDLNVYWGFLRDLRVERSILLTFFVRMLQHYFFEKYR